MYKDISHVSEPINYINSLTVTGYVGTLKMKHEFIILLFHIRYMNGAASNPDVHILAMAGAQVKKGLEIAKKLGAENFGTYLN